MRDRRSVRWHRKIWAAIESAAKDAGLPLNRWLEHWVWRKLQDDGLLPKDELPPPDGRGGRRKGAGRKPKDS